MPELKPCICGAKPLTMKSYWAKGYYIMCSNHACDRPFGKPLYNKQKAIEVWNQRADAEVKDGKIKEECSFCFGTGKREVDIGDENDVLVTCDDCRGKGYTEIEQQCQT